MNPIYQSARIDYDKAWGLAGILCPIATIQHVKECFKKAYPDTNNPSVVHSLKRRVVRPATVWQHLARAVILSIPIFGSLCLLIYDHYADLGRWNRLTDHLNTWVNEGGSSENKANRKEAAEKICDACRRESIRLELKSLKLTSLPEGIGLLTHLTNLSVEDNQLTSLPEEISGLPHLIRLSLAENHFASFPTEVLSFPKLRTLNMSCNRIDVLPPEVFRVTNLTQLDLTGNPQLPPESIELLNNQLKENSERPLRETLGKWIREGGVEGVEAARKVWEMRRLKRIT